MEKIIETKEYNEVKQMAGLMDSQIGSSVIKITDQTISFIPTLVMVILLIIVGWLLGKFLGKIVATILDKIGLDDLIDKTMIGDMIKKGGISTVSLFDTIVRWFIYIVFAIIIVDLLKINVVANFIAQIILFIPLIITALIVIIGGLLIVDFIAEVIRKVIVAIGIDDKINASSMGNVLKKGNISISGLLAGIVKLFGYIIIFITASEILQLRIITAFLVKVIDYIPHVFTGILILIIGFLSIDLVVDYLQNTLKEMKVEGAEIVLPALRGFLLLLVILLTLDTLLIDTSIFYTFLGPLAWGLAIVIAFKWGVKESLVAYARERKNL